MGGMCGSKDEEGLPDLRETALGSVLGSAMGKEQRDLDHTEIRQLELGK